MVIGRFLQRLIDGAIRSAAPRNKTGGQEKKTGGKMTMVKPARMSTVETTCPRKASDRTQEPKP